MSDIESSLIEQAVGGDSNALGMLLERSAAQLSNELRRENQRLSPPDIDDVMQVTFLEAFLHIRRFDPSASGSFIGWLRRIAQNNVRDLVRERDRAKRPPADKRVDGGTEQSYVALIDMIGGTTGTPSHHAAAREAQHMVEQAIAKLPESYQQVVRMYDLQGRTIDDVGRALGRSSGAVYMLRARAHVRLRDILGSDSKFFSRTA